MSTDPNTLQQEFRVLLKKSKSAKPEELPAICERLTDCIKRGVPLYDPSIKGYNLPLLWYLIKGMYPLEVIKCIYEGNKSVVNVVLHNVEGYNRTESRCILYKNYDIQVCLSDTYGFYFLDMTDDNVDNIEYFLACLKLLNIKEKDFDWAIAQKYGSND